MFKIIINDAVVGPCSKQCWILTTEIKGQRVLLAQQFQAGTGRKHP